MHPTSSSSIAIAVALGALLVSGVGLRGSSGDAEAVPASAAEPEADTLEAWDRYVRAVETRIAGELSGPFGSPDRHGASANDARITRLEETAAGRPLEVPNGLIHHWRGRVFLPAASLDEVLARVADPSAADLEQDDVMAARVLARGPGWLRVHLRLQRSQLVTVVYDTEHAVRYTRHSSRLGSSRSVATRIAEIADPGTARERERPPGEDRGFLWRLNAYWRYEQHAAGVLVTCESISLSRTVPALVRGAVRPLIDRIARESMERTLLALRARFAGRPSPGASR